MLKPTGPLPLVLPKNITWRTLRKRPFSHNRYREFYPVRKPTSIPTLGEGGTPMAPALSHPKFNLNFKLESLNPTGSFKDRGSTIELGKAIESKFHGGVVATTGNMGVSLATYAARANFPLRVYVPQSTSTQKKKIIAAHGAELKIVRGTYSDAARKAESAAKTENLRLLGDYTYRAEGEKSVGFEIVDQLNPDLIFLPVGNGNLMRGIWKGLRELHALKLLSSLPKLIGVQASGCSPLVSAFSKKSPTFKPTTPQTIANAIACGSPIDGTFALAAARQSRGNLISVTDHQIVTAMNHLARKEGIISEPGGAAAYAGFLKLQKQLNPKAKIAVIVSGKNTVDFF